MSSALVTLDAAAGVATLTLRRPDALNALSSELCRGILEAAERVDQDGEARVLVVTGEGRAFSAGADLKQREGAAPEAIWAHNRLIFSIPLAFERLAVPVIAAVNGFALGGGCEIALGCDLRWASSAAEFGCPEVTRGIIPAAGGTQRLARLIGQGRAMDLILTGRRIDAEEALRLGLVNGVAAPDDLRAAVDGVARRIAANAPLAVQAAKRAIRYGVSTTLQAGLELEGQLQRMLYASEDSREGIAAFREGRPPRWTAR